MLRAACGSLILANVAVGQEFDTSYRHTSGEVTYAHVSGTDSNSGRSDIQAVPDALIKDEPYNDRVTHPYFVEYHGFIADGHDALQARMTPEAAKGVCASMPNCEGFTFQKECAATQWHCEELIYFKKEWVFIPSANSAFVSYKREFARNEWGQSFEETRNCVDSDGENCVRYTWRRWGLGLGTWMLWFIFACLYKARVVDNLKQMPEKWKGKQDPLFLDWARDERRSPWQCIFSFCCTSAVAAKNYEVTGVCSYWPAWCWLQCGICCFAYPFVALSRAIWSMQLKTKMGIETTCLKEVLCSLFCFPCEVGREANDVDAELGIIVNGKLEVEAADISLVEKVEKVTGLDIDGDGTVGERRFCFNRPDTRWNCRTCGDGR